MSPSSSLFQGFTTSAEKSCSSYGCDVLVGVASVCVLLLVWERVCRGLCPAFTLPNPFVLPLCPFLHLLLIWVTLSHAGSLFYE